MLRVRAHHKGLQERIEDTFCLERAEDFADCPHDYADTVGKDHGRIEIRRCWDRVATDTRCFIPAYSCQGSPGGRDRMHGPSIPHDLQL